MKNEEWSASTKFWVVAWIIISIMFPPFVLTIIGVWIFTPTIVWVERKMGFGNNNEEEK